MFGIFKRKRGNRAFIDAIYAALVAQARDPILFQDLAIEDNFEGRFEALTLIVVVATRRLKAMPAPAPDLAQDIIDHVFAEFDRALREAGIGDLTVPKRMKTMASAFMGRASAYDQSLRTTDDEALVEALNKNIFASRADRTHQARHLAEFVKAFDKALSEAIIESFATTIKSFSPSRFIAKA